MPTGVAAPATSAIGRLGAVVRERCPLRPLDADLAVGRGINVTRFPTVSVAPSHGWGRRRPLVCDRPCRLGFLGSGQADQGELSLGVAAGAALQAQDTADVRQVDPACRRCRPPYSDRWRVPDRSSPPPSRCIAHSVCATGHTPLHLPVSVWPRLGSCRRLTVLDLTGTTWARDPWVPRLRRAPGPAQGPDDPPRPTRAASPAPRAITSAAPAGSARRRTCRGFGGSGAGRGRLLAARRRGPGRRRPTAGGSTTGPPRSRSCEWRATASRRRLAGRAHAPHGPAY